MLFSCSGSPSSPAIWSRSPLHRATTLSTISSCIPERRTLSNIEPTSWRRSEDFLGDFVNVFSTEHRNAIELFSQNGIKRTERFKIMCALHEPVHVVGIEWLKCSSVHSESLVYGGSFSMTSLSCDLFVLCLTCPRRAWSSAFALSLQQISSMLLSSRTGCSNPRNRNCCAECLQRAWFRFDPAAVRNLLWMSTIVKDKWNKIYYCRIREDISINSYAWSNHWVKKSRLPSFVVVSALRSTCFGWFDA